MKKKLSTKEVYANSKKSIKLILELIGKPEPNKPTPLPDHSTFEKISTLTKSMMELAHFEPENQYSRAIIDVTTWIHFVFQKDYLQSHQNAYPNPVFVFKKGIEVLHAFLHRDLRRKQFSAEEDEIYRNYKNLSSKLPAPRPPHSTKETHSFLKSS